MNLSCFCPYILAKHTMPYYFCTRTGPFSPLYLMEYCEHRLKDWIKSAGYGSDVTSNMVRFCADIARGMEHLHEHGVRLKPKYTYSTCIKANMLC